MEVFGFYAIQRRTKTQNNQRSETIIIAYQNMDILD